MNHPYLKNKVITIEAIANPDKWRDHFSKFANDPLGQSTIEFNMNNLKDRSYSYPNTDKQFCVPLAAQGVKPTLDNLTKQACPDLQNQELTEQEYFEKVLNKDLNPYQDVKSNWWADVKKNKSGFPIIKDGKLRLNLALPVEMIQYRIFEEHFRNEVAFSMAELKTNRLNTYLYVIKDASVEDSAVVATGELIMKASVEAAKISEDKESIIRFFACLGKSLDSKQTLAQLKKPLFDLMQSNPAGFLENALDKNADLKYLVFKGRKTGVISYLPSKDSYTLPSSAQGKLMDIIDYLKQIKNQEELLNLEMEIEAKYVV